MYSLIFRSQSLNRKMQTPTWYKMIVQTRKKCKIWLTSIASNLSQRRVRRGMLSWTPKTPRKHKTQKPLFLKKWKFYRKCIIFFPKSLIHTQQIPTQEVSASIPDYIIRSQTNYRNEGRRICFFIRSPSQWISGVWSSERITFSMTIHLIFIVYFVIIHLYCFLAQDYFSWQVFSYSP